MIEDLERLVGRWIGVRNEMQKRCPSSCHGEIEALDECINDLLDFLKEAGG